MRKIYLLFFTALFLSVFISSCKKETNGGEKFSSASVEVNKANVEDAGISLVNTMSDMKSIETVDVVVNLGDILSNSSLKKGALSKDSKLFYTLETFAATANGEKKLNDLFKAMASSEEFAGDPESIQQFWDENVGTYDWNGDIDDWDIVLGGDKIIFNFPSTDVSSSNDAKITIYNYSGIIVSNPLEDDYSGDLPISLNADLKVGSKTLVTFVFAASYNSDGVPNAIAADLTIENFKFEIDIINTTTVVSVNYKFLENDNVIMDMGASGKGLFTNENIDANTQTFTETYDDWDLVYNELIQDYEWVPVTRTNEWKETDFEEILNSANAHFQLFNIAIKGDVDVKGLVDQINIIEDNRDNEIITEEEAFNQEVEKINKFLNLRVVNVSKNEIIAKAQAYVKKEITPYYTDLDIDFRLTFGDGSLVDLQTYTDSGFEDFIAELNSLIDDLNLEYDLGLEHVEN